MKKSPKKSTSQQRRVQRLPMWEIESVLQVGSLEAFAFRGLLDQADGIRSLTAWREGVDETLGKYDKRWIAMCDGNITELTEWGARMAFVCRQFDEIDRNLVAFAHKPRLFDKDAVALAWSHVNAFRVAAEQMLDYNEA